MNKYLYDIIVYKVSNYRTSRLSKLFIKQELNIEIKCKARGFSLKDESRNYYSYCGEFKIKYNIFHKLFDVDVNDLISKKLKKFVEKYEDSIYESVKKEVIVDKLNR
jgi:hypothetical protein